MARSSSTTSTRPCMPSPRQRERDAELGGAPDLAHHVDGPLVRLDDLLRDRHTEAGPLLLRREEGVEDALDLVRRDAATVVTHPDGRAPVAVLDEQVDAPVLGHAV